MQVSLADYDATCSDIVALEITRMAVEPEPKLPVALRKAVAAVSTCGTGVISYARSQVSLVAIRDGLTSE